MKVVDAKDLVLDLMLRDLHRHSSLIPIDGRSPDPNDPGKFFLAGKVARAVHHHDGWYVYINRDWFNGSFAPPNVRGSDFHWYAFAIPRLAGRTRDHYLVCDYLQVREWTLGFRAPLGRDHRSHKDWRADIRVDKPDQVGAQAYFRWGDEPPNLWQYPERIVALDNVLSIGSESMLLSRGLHVGTASCTGESEAHCRLKRYVASNPALFQVRESAQPKIEHRFITGDTVDVLFTNHDPSRTVAEIELSGTENIVVGIHQAIKYRVLAAAESGFRLNDPKELAALVVSYEHGGEPAEELADAYGVKLFTVDKNVVLAPVEA